MERAVVRMPAPNDWLVTIEPVSDDAGAWTRLASEVPGAILYHRSRWLEVLRRAFGMHFVAAMAVDRSGTPAAGCLFAKLGGLPWKRKRMVALPFSDSCPPLWRDGNALATLLERLVADGDSLPSREIRGLAAPAPWKVIESYREWRLELGHSAASLEKGTSEHFRRQVRKGFRQKLSIERGSAPDMVRRFYSLMLETRRRQGIPPPPIKLFTTAGAIFGPDLDVWLASKDGRDLAGLITLRDGSRLYYRWAARIDPGLPGANHLLVWTLIENSAQKFERLELGRADLRNSGLNRFKHELGATAFPLPYSFFPEAEARMSPEILTGLPRLASHVWRHLPLSLTRVLGTGIYRYFA